MGLLRTQEKNREHLVAGGSPLARNNTLSKSKMISRRQGGGDKAYCTYVEEDDDAANKDSALI